MSRRIISSLIVMMLFAVEVYAQCPMCKASVESSQSSGNKSVGMGLNVGILMLMAAVYLILFSVGVLWYRKFRRSQSEYAG